jgi:flagellar protein FlaJ
MFLEFSRNLAESVSTGTPISKSIINLDKNYGPLTPYVSKLSNQISVGIPINRAMQTFALDVDSPAVTRAVTLISEAEKAGGEIDYILESSAKSIAEVENLKKERRATIYNLTVQGYIIFFIFIGIMLLLQFKILPLTNNLASFDLFSTDFTNVENSGLRGEYLTPQDLANNFLYLLVMQGIFAGLVIGKLTEGSLKSGVKHSFILTISAYLISTGVRVLLTRT